MSFHLGDLIHDITPHLLVHIDISVIHIGITTIPDRGRIIRCHARKPEIVILGSRTGLTNVIHTGLHPCILTGTTGHNVPHRLDQLPAGSCFHGRMGPFRIIRIRIVDHQISVMVINLGIINRFSVNAQVCDGRIRCSQFQIRNTEGDTSQCQRLVDIRHDIAVTCSIVIHDGGEAVIDQIIIRHLRGQLRNGLDRDDIHGITNRYSQRIHATISVVPVMNFDAVLVFVWRIVKTCSQTSAGIDVRSEGCQHLKCGTRLPLRHGSAVESEVCLLLSTSSVKRLHIARMLIQNGEGHLRLRRKTDILRQEGRTRLLHHHFLIGFGRRTGLTLIRINVIVFVIPRQYTVVADHGIVIIVVLGLPVRIQQCQLVIQRHRVLPGEILFVVIQRVIHDVLDLHILNGIHTVSAVVKLIPGLRGGHAVDLHEIVPKLEHHGIHVIGVIAGLLLTVGGHTFHAIIYIVIQSGHILCFRNIAQLLHLVEHILPTDRIVLRIQNRIITVRVLSDPGDHGDLRKCQIHNGFVEVAVCRSFHTADALSQINRIQIILHDLFLGVPLLQLDGQILLLHLSGQPLHEGLLIHTDIEDMVLDQLLRNG